MKIKSDEIACGETVDFSFVDLFLMRCSFFAVFEMPMKCEIFSLYEEKNIINKCQENVLNVHKAEVNFFLTFFEIMHFSLLLPIR